MNQHWFSVVGLFLDLIGAVIIIFRGTYLSSKEKAELLRTDPMAGLGGEKWGEVSYELKNIVAALDKASKASVVGFIFIAVGSALQIVGSWP